MSAKFSRSVPAWNRINPFDFCVGEKYFKYTKRDVYVVDREQKKTEQETYDDDLLRWALTFASRIHLFHSSRSYSSACLSNTTYVGLFPARGHQRPPRHCCDQSLRRWCLFYCQHKFHPWRGWFINFVAMFGNLSSGNTTRSLNGQGGEGNVWGSHCFPAVQVVDISEMGYK